MIPSVAGLLMTESVVAEGEEFDLIGLSRFKLMNAFCNPVVLFLRTYAIWGQSRIIMVIFVVLLVSIPSELQSVLYSYLHVFAGPFHSRFRGTQNESRQLRM